MTFGLTDKAQYEREPGRPDQLMPSTWFFTGLDGPTVTATAEIVRCAAAERRSSGA